MASKTATPFITGMRDAYFDALYDIFKKDKNAVFITADNGAPTLDKFASDFPDQYYQVGIAEQQMFGLAAGMAVEGRKVYTYAIAPFVTLRPAEFVKLDMCAMNMPIVNIGVGAGYSYDIMGPTHHTMEDIAVMRVFPNLKIYSPCDAFTAKALANIMHEDKAPIYVRFDRAGVPDLYAGVDTKEFIAEGLTRPRIGKDKVAIISTGRMVHNALAVAEELKSSKGVDPTVIDIFRLKPINIPLLLELVKNYDKVVTYEEHFLAGGLGSAILEILNDNGVQKPVLRIGQGDRFVFDMGGRQEIWRLYGLDPSAVTKRIGQWL